jgi:fused signal recognition particle receptor
VEQLAIWAERTGSHIVKQPMGADPGSVCYDALSAADAREYDAILIDTAGRLHTKSNLMEELKKIDRVIKKVMPSAPHETLLVLDATTGQNALSQAKLFSEAVRLTGFVMTKLDGTAKGGILIALRDLFDIPVLKIGIGENVEDLRDFDPQSFTDALFEN